MNTTPWANQSKQSSTWAPGTKNPAKFTPVDAPIPALYAPNDTPTPNSWGPTSEGKQTYFYDSDMPYDSDLLQYDFLVNNNQLNQRLRTPWKAS